MTLRTVLASLAEDATTDEMLQDCPTLSRADVRAAIAFTGYGGGRKTAKNDIGNRIMKLQPEFRGYPTLEEVQALNEELHKL